MPDNILQLRLNLLCFYGVDSVVCVEILVHQLYFKATLSDLKVTGLQGVEGMDDVIFLAFTATRTSRLMFAGGGIYRGQRRFVSCRGNLTVSIPHPVNEGGPAHPATFSAIF